MAKIDTNGAVLEKFGLIPPGKKKLQLLFINRLIKAV